MWNLQFLSTHFSILTGLSLNYVYNTIIMESLSNSAYNSLFISYVLKPYYSVHTKLKFSYHSDEHLIIMECLQVYFVFKFILSGIKIALPSFSSLVFAQYYFLLFTFKLSMCLCFLSCKQRIAVAGFLYFKSNLIIWLFDLL